MATDTDTANRTMSTNRARTHQPTRWGRLAAWALLGIALSVVLALQAASSVLTVPQPAYAARLFPLNGLAVEQDTVRSLTENVTSEADVVPVARDLADLARRAIAMEALSPRAHAVLALGESDESRKVALLTAATRVNRRDLMMQGLVLDHQVSERDFPGALATLDRLLRVHPEREEFFFPLLYRALRERAALPAFVEILDGGSEWHRRFIVRAPVEANALSNLALIRGRLKLKDEEFDRRLIMQLAEEGDMATAGRIYRNVTGVAEGGPAFGTIPWIGAFPPFDWKLADQPTMRGQLEADGKQLDVFVRSGRGGILAQRIVEPGAGPFAVVIDHALAPVDQVRDVRLQLRCGGNGQPFYDERFSPGINRFEIPALPAACEGFANLAIYARAWSGRSQITGTIGEIELVAGRSPD